MHVHRLVLKKKQKNPNYVIFFFYEDDIQLQIQVLPPGQLHTSKQNIGHQEKA